MKVELMNAIQTLLLLLITGVLIPWVKNKIGEQKFLKVANIIKDGVQAAEMVYKSTGLGSTKIKYVQAYMISKGIEITPEMITKIESAVFSVQTPKLIEGALLTGISDEAGE